MKIRLNKRVLNILKRINWARIIVCSVISFIVGFIIGILEKLT